MAECLPRSITTSMKFENGPAIGISNRWVNGQYCSILTPVGIVGCGIYDVVVPAEFNQALAVAQGTPECPLVDPEDLLEKAELAITRVSPLMLAIRRKLIAELIEAAPITGLG